MDKEKIYTTDYYSAFKKKEILPFVTTWMKHHTKWTKSDRERQILHGITYKWNPKKKKGQTHKNELPGAGDTGETEAGKRIQIFSYKKINRWGPNV